MFGTLQTMRLGPDLALALAPLETARFWFCHDEFFFLIRCCFFFVHDYLRRYGRERMAVRLYTIISNTVLQQFRRYNRPPKQKRIRHAFRADDPQTAFHISHMVFRLKP